MSKVDVLARILKPTQSGLCECSGGAGLDEYEESVESETGDEELEDVDSLDE